MQRIIKMLVVLAWASLVGQKAHACICSEILTIENLDQLKDYTFIAHVKIIEDGEYKKGTLKDPETIGFLKIEILELFKGEKINELLEYSKRSSCDIGISPGEEWVLFGRTIEGKIAVVACDRNQRYKNKNELRHWKYGWGFYELRKLKKLYGHSEVTYDNETRKEFYSSGKPEIEETYKNGMLNGDRRIWYPNGQLLCQEFYVNDSLDGKSEWYYPSGQLSHERYFSRGKPYNVSRFYYDSAINPAMKHLLIKSFYKTEDSLKFVYHRIQVQYETVYDNNGRVIISRNYRQLGKIHSETLIDPDKNFKTIIYYHENGLVSSIGYSLNDKNFGHYQSYDQNGRPGRGWDYDKEGKVIKN